MPGSKLIAGVVKSEDIIWIWEVFGALISFGSEQLSLTPRMSHASSQASDPCGCYAVLHVITQLKKCSRTRRKAPLNTGELIEELNPVIRGWGLYYCKAHVRKLFHRLDGWIVRRIWSHRYKRWRPVMGMERRGCIDQPSPSANQEWEEPLDKAKSYLAADR